MAGFEFLSVLLLVGVLVVGVVYGNEALKTKIIPSAKSHSPIDIKVVEIPDPSQYVKNAHINRQQSEFFCGEWFCSPTEKVRMRPAGRYGSGFRAPNLSLIGPLHRQNGANRNLTLPFDDMSIGAPTVNCIKLASHGRTDFNSYGNWMSTPHIRKIEIADNDSRALIQNKGALGNFNLLVHCIYTSGSCLSGLLGFPRLPTDDYEGHSANHYQEPIGPFEGCVPMWRVVIGFVGLVGGTIFGIKGISYRRLFGGLGIAAVSIILWATGHEPCEEHGGNNNQQCECSSILHNNIVPQKYQLTRANYWGTVIVIGREQMANVLPMERKVAVISHWRKVLAFVRRSV